MQKRKIVNKLNFELMKRALHSTVGWFMANWLPQNSNTCVAKLPYDPLDTYPTRTRTMQSMKWVVAMILLIPFLQVNAQTQTVILTSGSSWTVPTGVYSVTVECVGGGGAGGGSTTAQYGGSGGGGGAYSKQVVTVTPNEDLTYQIGNGGTGSNDADGGAGGDTWLKQSTTTVVLAKGGAGGARRQGTAGAGGAAANGIGSTKFSGGGGKSGTGIGGYGGGGGGAGGATSDGTTATGQGGAAGNSPGGNGGSGAGWIEVNTNGNTGNLYGGGGGGSFTCYACALLSSKGGNGAQGFIRITYCVAPSNVTAGTAKTICNSGSATLDGAATASTTIFSENFEIAPVDYYIFGAWSDYVITNGYSDWYYSNISPLSGSVSLALFDSYWGNDNSYDWGGSSSDIAFTSAKIDATGYTNLKLNFKWKCGGEAGYDYGEVVWSTNGTTWNNVSATQYQGQTSTQTVTNLDLSAADGQQFYLGFKWRNNGTVGSSPGFMVDDISITGTPTVSYSWSPSTALSATNVAVPTASPTSTTTYVLTSTQGTCSAPTSSVVVTVRPALDPSSAVATLTSCQLNTSAPYADLTANAAPSGAQGTWSVTTAPGTVTSPNANNTQVTGLSNTGATSTLSWSLSYTSGLACTVAKTGINITPLNLATTLNSVSLQNDGTATSTGTPAQTRYACRACSVKDGNTYTYYDAVGKIIATIVDKTSNAADLGSTEVCIGYDYSPSTPPTSGDVKTITDNFGRTQPYLPRSWTIKPAAGSDATVTLYFTSDELAALQTRAATTQYNFSGLDLAVTKYPGGIGGGQFIAPKSAGGVFTPSLFGSYNTGYQVTFDVNSFSTFYVHPQTFPFAALPVELISFAGYHESLRNTLIWKTASERNTDRFEIEKSFDGINWEHIGTQKAVGNTNGESEYTFYDNAPKVGNNYYRLKIADYDQSYEYSKVINVTVGATEMENSISVYPNPTNGDVTMMVYSFENRSGRIQVVNVLGQVMMQEEVSLQKGSTNIPIRLHGLSNGLYTIIFSDASGKTHTEKVLKQ